MHALLISLTVINLAASIVLAYKLGKSNKRLSDSIDRSQKQYDELQQQWEEAAKQFLTAD